jgi:glutathione S-transferase
MNPLGKMPVLEHDGEYVIESEVICQYLEDRCPTPTIFPGDALARARARTVSRVVDLYVWPDANQLLHQYLDPAWLGSAALEATKARLGIPDPARAGPNLAAWWRQVNAAPLTSAFVPECRAATDAYLAMIMKGGH